MHLWTSPFRFQGKELRCKFNNRNKGGTWILGQRKYLEQKGVSGALAY